MSWTTGRMSEGKLAVALIGINIFPARFICRGKNSTGESLANHLDGMIFFIIKTFALSKERSDLLSRVFYQT